MKIQKLTFEVPDFLTIDQYAKMNAYKGDSKAGRMAHAVATMTGRPMGEVVTWDMESIAKIANIYANIADHNEEFHSIIEWDGQLYGYAHIKQSSLGEYIDLESLATNLEENMHKIAATFYRPITKHRFDSLSFTVKQGIRMLNNSVANVFDWYEVEKYDSSKRKEREEKFKEFPSHIFLGALSFFLSTAVLYLNNIAYSEGRMTRTEVEKQAREILGFCTSWLRGRN